MYKQIDHEIKKIAKMTKPKLYYAYITRTLTHCPITSILFFRRGGGCRMHPHLDPHLNCVGDYMNDNFNVWLILKRNFKQ